MSDPQELFKYNYHGRRVLYTPLEPSNSTIVQILMDIETAYIQNKTEINYLYRYYKGEQPVLSRTKNTRAEINNKIVVNRANEIVSFKTGYLCGAPIQYIAQTPDEKVSRDVAYLNILMSSENKDLKDKELIEWQMICGTAYRMVVSDPASDEDDAPYEIITLDPRTTYVIYDAKLGHKPVLGVTGWVEADESGNDVMVWACYSRTQYWLVKDNEIRVSENHYYGMIPIFEYPANTARLGSFEIVLPLLDAINEAESDRLDGLDQFVQSFIKFVNCDITPEEFEDFKAKGAIKVFSHEGNQANVDIVSDELSQSETQVLIDDLYDEVLTICGMPNRNGGSSTSDTGSAVIFRDGWSAAEARAKDSETMFKGAEKEMLKLILRILKGKNTKLPGSTDTIDLTLKDIDMQFTRRNYEGIQSKAQVLTMMLAQPKIHPKLAFEHCGMFSDPEAAYQISEQYYDEQMQKWEPIEIEENADVSEGGSGT